MASDVIDSRFEKAIEIISECARTCTWCADWDIRMADATMVECARLCLDCADVCATCTTLLTRESSVYGAFCRLCAEICDACAAECAQHAHYEHCRACAEACTRCAEECRQLAA